MPIGALLAQLVEDARALAKVEMALFRTDFYRRIGRARTGALLLLIGAMMGQAAAVTFLVTLSFLLTPLLGRLGAASLSVVLGLGAAALLIRIGVRKLLLVVEDPDDDDDERAPDRMRSPVDEMFERVRQRSQAARNQLIQTVGETQARLHPQALIADLADMVVDQAQALSHRAIDAVRRRPIRATAGVIALLLVVIRPPIYGIVTRLAGATRRPVKSFRGKRAGSPAQDEETIP
ncbi:phage holin family protein [Sphingomonadaceae bacterium G21617-S1]|nr:phage holin family protein [Sphingomonadaceae bacterium G21617-S1]